MSIENARIKLITLKQELADELADNDIVLLGINNRLDQAIATLTQIGGFQVVENRKIEFPPVSEFMGDTLTLPEPITENTLTPQDIERKNFIAKVDKLQSDLPGLTNDQVLESYRLDQNVIRGVAKRVGFDDFKTAEITEPYIQKIREALEGEEKSKAAAAEFEDNLGK